MAVAISLLIIDELINHFLPFILDVFKVIIASKSY